VRAEWAGSPVAIELQFAVDLDDYYSCNHHAWSVYITENEFGKENQFAIL
jgi:hypothetical protein